MSEDVERLHRLIRETLPGLEAHGLEYGPFHHRYESGREGDAYRASIPLGVCPGGTYPLGVV